MIIELSPLSELDSEWLPGRQSNRSLTVAARKGFVARCDSGCHYSTVTLLAKLRGWSTSQPRRTAM
jgi:hypothetical protein